jgi:Fic-DOC domain mobile mystery protein B
VSNLGVFEEPAHATPLSPEERAGLKLAHITERQQLNEVEQQNIALAISWAGSRKHNPVREPFGRGLHKRMFGDVWTWAGAYRTNNKNLGVEHGMIVPRLYEVFEQIDYWVDHQTFPPDEIAVRFHHALVVVHPFPNGNGRWSRLMGDVLALRLGQTVFSWSGGALADAGALRASYIAALQAADIHNFAPLIDFARH